MRTTSRSVRKSPPATANPPLHEVISFAQIVEHFGQADFDPETVRQYRNRFASRDPDHPWLSEDDAGLIGKIGALRRDRATGQQGATVAGLLLFGTFAVLREALPGDHADYRGQGGIVIERYPERIELSNPGSLPVSREQLLRGSVSECRNKGLQLMFQMIGGGEKAGSGMDKIRAGWRSQHWRSPKIEETVQPDRVRLVLPMVSLIPPEVDAELRQQFGERFARLDPTAVQDVVTARVEGTVTNGRMQEITGEHPKDITGVLQGLVRDGLLEQQNQRRWASYRLVGYSLPGSPRTSGSSPQSPADSPHSGDASPFGGAIPAHLQALVPLAKPARSHKRLPADEMRAVIERLCQGRWLAPYEKRAKGGRGIGLRRDAPTGAGTATDLVPLSRTAFRHLAVTLSAMPPERCPPSPWNPVRHRPEHATSAAARRTTSPAQSPPPTPGPRCWPRTATRCSTTTATRWKSWASSRARWH